MCPTCGLNEPYNPNGIVSHYDHSVLCEGCHVREGNIDSLLRGILKIAKKMNIVGQEVKVSEFIGIRALLALDIIEKNTPEREEHATSTTTD